MSTDGSMPDWVKMAMTAPPTMAIAGKITGSGTFVGSGGTGGNCATITKAPRDPNRGPYVSPVDYAKPAPVVGPVTSAALKARAAAVAGKPTGVSSTYGPAKPVDPLDVEYDGVMLRTLLERDTANRCNDYVIKLRHGLRSGELVHSASAWQFTPAQRAAVSAHWSAQLRAKVQASEAAVKARSTSVVIGVDAEDLPW